MTLENMTLNLGGGAFCDGQVYVALSRCKTIKGISLVSPLKITDIKASIVALAFYDELKKHSKPEFNSVENSAFTAKILKLI